MELRKPAEGQSDCQQNIQFVRAEQGRKKLTSFNDFYIYSSSDIAIYYPN